jgi:uncharacterized radical SAM protein YgiQ
MGEKTIIEIAQKLQKEKSITGIRGLSYISDENKYEYLQLPSFEETLADKNKFIEMFNLFYLNNDPISAKGLVQKHGNRFLIQNPPQFNPTTEEMDYYHDLKYERETHPFYRKWGEVKALDTIRFSINTHRGCYGECNFCAIAVHQGQTISGRSEKSIINEAIEFTKFKNFKGNISDVGGPTANMYGFECAKKLKLGNCADKRCVAPTTCKALKPTHKPQIDLLKKLKKLEGIKKVFVASGIRYDMVLDDKLYGEEYLKEIVQHHTSGQMKIAPEHSEDKVLELMGKPGKRYLTDFRDKFYKYSKEVGKNQFLTYYMIAAHPGCTENDMHKLKEFTSEKLEISPEQVQIFTPTPSTYSTLMYYTEIDPFTGNKIFVEKDTNKMIVQKNIATAKREIHKVEHKLSGNNAKIYSKNKRFKKK